MSKQQKASGIGTFSRDRSLSQKHCMVMETFLCYSSLTFLGFAQRKWILRQPHTFLRLLSSHFSKELSSSAFPGRTAVKPSGRERCLALRGSWQNNETVAIP